MRKEKIASVFTNIMLEWGNEQVIIEKGEKIDIKIPLDIPDGWRIPSGDELKHAFEEGTPGFMPVCYFTGFKSHHNSRPTEMNGVNMGNGKPSWVGITMVETPNTDSFFATQGLYPSRHYATTVGDICFRLVRKVRKEAQ